jgi:hypothetical protein
METDMESVMIEQNYSVDEMCGEAPRSNVVFPKIIAWSGDFWEQNLRRLRENPTRKQLEIFKRNAEDQFGKLFAVDMLVVLLGSFFDDLADMPPLTPEQHERFYTKLLGMTTPLLKKWGDELNGAIRTTFNL